MIFDSQAPRVYSQARREAKGLDGTAELVSNTLTYVIVLLQWLLAFFMDSEPEYVIGAGTVVLILLLLISSCSFNPWETSRKHQKALVDWLGNILGLVNRHCFEFCLVHFF